MLNTLLKNATITACKHTNMPLGAGIYDRHASLDTIAVNRMPSSLVGHACRPFYSTQQSVNVGGLLARDGQGKKIQDINPLTKSL